MSDSQQNIYGESQTQINSAYYKKKQNV